MDDVFNLLGKMFCLKFLLLCVFLGINWKNNKEKICKLVVMVELIYFVFLIYDDIVDDFFYRRGKVFI